MTLPEAARLLGTSPRTLRRRLLALEASSGKRLLVRSGGSSHGVRYLVTLSLLRLHCPEMFDVKTELDRIVATRFEQTDEKIFELRLRQNAIAAKMREFDGRLRAVETA